jgi:hypothetical protein
VVELEALRRKALDLLMRALRRLYADLPELIAERRRGRTLARRHDV